MPAAGSRFAQPLASLCLALVLSLGTPAWSDTQTDTEIQYLLAFVAASQCSFVRNGTAHDPADAADHLRLKYSRGANYVDSAEQFIDRLASESSWSGKPYTVICEGVTLPSRDWLYQALEQYRQNGPAPQPAP